ncbi:MAG: 16S rRNA (guanine(527)-N(7))-methyltransferase RsmG [Bacilli bacterium]|nr:16S rRNA (guanine(527)-N(7))-methyltransferase RsmG [Bacilli bacterium]
MNKENLKVNISEFIDTPNVEILEKLQQKVLNFNNFFNLTAINDEEKFRELMIYDSLLPLKYLSLDNKKILDFGTGAGFPGLPLAICSKGDFTLIDSTNKKIEFIKEFVKENKINNVTAISARGEEYAFDHREEYDVVIARAVSLLPILIEICVPMLKVGGVLLAMKSNKANEEIEISQNALKQLDASVEEVKIDELPESKENRTLIIIKKNKITKNRYPRKYSEIKHKHL